MRVGEVERRLVAAGVELLAEAGTDALSLREIARRAGVSHGAPRRYFPTHQALLAAIAREGYRRLGTLVAETIGEAGAEPRAAVEGLARRYVGFARDEPGMFALMFRHDLLRGNNIGLRAESTPLFGVLVDLLRRARLPQPTASAAALWAALHGIAQLWQWGSLQVTTGFDSPDPLIAAAVDAHLPASRTATARPSDAGRSASGAATAQPPGTGQAASHAVVDPPSGGGRPAAGGDRDGR